MESTAHPHTAISNLFLLAADRYPAGNVVLCCISYSGLTIFRLWVVAPIHAFPVVNRAVFVDTHHP